MSCTDTNGKAIKYGLELLDRLQKLDEDEADGSITKEKAIELRKVICGQMRSILWNIKPWKKSFSSSGITYYH